MQNLMNDVGEFLSVVGYFIYTGFYNFLIAVGGFVTKIVDDLAIPMLPSRSKILDYTYVSATLFLVFLVYVVYINVKTYSLFVRDKENAVERKYRICEARLLRNCFFGGALGGHLGMEKSRHKTRKPVFLVLVRIMLVLQILIFSFVCGFFGFWIYMS